MSRDVPLEVLAFARSAWGAGELGTRSGVEGYVTITKTATNEQDPHHNRFDPNGSLWNQEAHERTGSVTVG